MGRACIQPAFGEGSKAPRAALFLFLSLLRQGSVFRAEEKIITAFSLQGRRLCSPRDSFPERRPLAEIRPRMDRPVPSRTSRSFPFIGMSLNRAFRTESDQEISVSRCIFFGECSFLGSHRKIYTSILLTQVYETIINFGERTNNAFHRNL